MSLSKLIPDLHEVLRLEPQELAGYVVQDLKGKAGPFIVRNYIQGAITSYGDSFKPHLSQAVAEALAWLSSEALLIPDYTGSITSGFLLSKRAHLLSKPRDINDLAKIRETLPKALLHPLIAQHSSPIFHSGKYDTAVFEAFKQVEIAVKKVSGLSFVGADLMKQSFACKGAPGPLTDISTDRGEQEGMMFVFAGAIQLFRNSTGHNNVVMGPAHAAALIVHASTLLYLVDECETRINSTTQSAVNVSP